MPKIVPTFNYPEAPLPRYKFGDRYQADDLVAEKEIPDLQAQWEPRESARVKESRFVASEQNLSPKFDPGMRVKFTKETGCNLVGLTAEVVSCRYVTSESWSGWVYKLTNDHLTESIEIGELWLELAYPPSQSPTLQSLTEINCS